VQYLSSPGQTGGGDEGGDAHAGKLEIANVLQFCCPNPVVQTVGLACCPGVFQFGGPAAPFQLAVAVEDPSKPA
jgi:hypothetical protein